MRQIEWENFKLDDKELNKVLAKKMTNPYYFSDRALRVGFNITLGSHQINHSNSKIIIKPNYPEFGIEFGHINKILKEMAFVYARLTNQDKFKYQTVFSTKFDKQDEDGQMLDEVELFINLNINHKLTESGLDNFNVRFSLDEQIQRQELKYSGWRFDEKKINYNIFYKTGEVIGSSYIKIPLRSSAILNIQNDVKYCFIGSILAHLHPIAYPKNGHPTRVSI